MESLDDKVSLFEEIFLETRDQVFGFTKKMMKDDSKVQDCMQQCYMKLWESMDRIDTKKEMLPLLYTYSRNICIDHFRKNARYVWMEDLDVLVEKMNVENEVEGRIRLDEADRKVAELFRQMSPRRREVYSLIKFDGFSYSEVSEQLQISVSTVEKHMHEARKSLSPENLVKLLLWLCIVRGL
jgi:RNA polymerase sigma factor (sigma-70 family)